MNSGRGRRPNRKGDKLEVGQLLRIPVSKMAKTLNENLTINCILDKKIRISLNTDFLFLELEYLDRKFLFNRFIQVISMPCNYGGVRYFGVCPGCENRVSALYLLGKFVKCRTCFRLCYWSQNRTLSDRLYSKEKEIKRKLEEDPFTRPKWMREKTFARLRNDFYLTEERGQTAAFFSLRTIRAVDRVLEEHGGIDRAARAWGMEWFGHS